jgi:hypothetical protein
VQAAMAIYFNQPNNRPTIEETARYYRERKIGAVIFPVDAERETGYRRYANEEVAEKAAANSDVLIPFASIDPAKGKAGAREARRLIREFGIRGFKFHPSMQGFFPNDRSAYVLYEAIAEAKLAACSIPGRPASARVCAAAPPSGSNTRTRCSSTTSPSIFPTCRSSSRIRPFLAGGGAVGRAAQAERLHRPFRLVAEIFSANSGALRELAAAAQNAVRLGLAGDQAGSLAARL